MISSGCLGESASPPWRSCGRALPGSPISLVGAPHPGTGLAPLAANCGEPRRIATNRDGQASTATIRATTRRFAAVRGGSHRMRTPRVSSDLRQSSRVRSAQGSQIFAAKVCWGQRFTLSCHDCRTSEPGPPRSLRHVSPPAHSADGRRSSAYAQNPRVYDH